MRFRLPRYTRFFFNALLVKKLICKLEGRDRSLGAHTKTPQNDSLFCNPTCEWDKDSHLLSTSLHAKHFYIYCLSVLTILKCNSLLQIGKIKCTEEPVIAKTILPPEPTCTLCELCPGASSEPPSTTGNSD